ncbi:MAG: aminotransferase class I/II-fold pyridoxal phosphate-dependent enzyme [Deltaproteobacteria bacterium]|nr:aminotransferase class I/II-fold pyridoxal phosphate-dependent enzyme [Deltaproteobacteria bacterium]
MNPLARELNKVIVEGNPYLMEMLSEIGKNLFFPKGILSQSAEAKQKAHRLNGTIGIAKEEGHAMVLPNIMASISGLAPEESVTYAPSFGIPALRRQWRIAMYEKNPSLAGREVSLPVVTNGITHGLSTFADVWLDPDDVVILPEMMWGNYNMIFSVRKHAQLSKYELFNETGGFNLEAFEAQVRAEAEKRDKICVLLNFPQNPSGYTITETEAMRIIDILLSVAETGTNIITVSDDAYFGLFYEPEILTESLFSRICSIHPRLLAVKLDGATKEDYVWGLRVGFITYGCPLKGDDAIIYDALERKTAGCIRGNISNCSHLSQSIVFKSMKSPGYSEQKAAKSAILMERAREVRSVLSDPKYNDAWDVYPFNSGYFMCIRLKTIESEKLRLHILDEYGVGLISLGAHDLRVAFSCIEKENIRELFDIVLKGVKDLEQATV